ncbi:MAG: hypothetical protein IK123_07690, partial [Lachnospiraceae bacterium]|nr:hypothetical protein [Lachnospiraceae bacterium]
MADYQEVCMLCHRSEDKAGKMIHLMNNICVCRDCLDRTMNLVNNFDLSKIGSDPDILASAMKEFLNEQTDNTKAKEGSSETDGPKPVMGNKEEPPEVKPVSEPVHKE